MLIQYGYALLTMVPCPLWFWSRWASGLFLISVFGWSVWNGATYYIDVFGQRFQKELEQLKKDVAKWQSTPDLMGKSGLSSPVLGPEGEKEDELDATGTIKAEQIPGVDGTVGSITDGKEDATNSVEKIPLLEESTKPFPSTSSHNGADEAGMRERK